ncbi:MAG: metal-sensitive transcriptional regulator [Candidatus Binataceae bacterium]
MPGARALTSSQAKQKSHRRPERLALDLAARLERAEGQLRGIKRMLGENAYCIDVLQQVSAVRRALDRLALLIVRDHLESCVSDAIMRRDAQAKIRELVATLDRFLA